MILFLFVQSVLKYNQTHIELYFGWENSPQALNESQSPIYTI